jgi:hypothetical protein
VLNAVKTWTFSNPPRAFVSVDGYTIIPLRITPNATRDIVLHDFLSQLVELHELLENVQLPLAAVLPEPLDEAPEHQDTPNDLL